MAPAEQINHGGDETPAPADRDCLKRPLPPSCDAASDSKRVAPGAKDGARADGAPTSLVDCEGSEFDAKKGAQESIANLPKGEVTDVAQLISLSDGSRIQVLWDMESSGEAALEAKEAVKGPDREWWGATLLPWDGNSHTMSDEETGEVHNVRRAITLLLVLRRVCMLMSIDFFFFVVVVGGGCCRWWMLSFCNRKKKNLTHATTFSLTRYNNQ